MPEADTVTPAARCAWVAVCIKLAEHLADDPAPAPLALKAWCDTGSGFALATGV